MNSQNVVSMNGVESVVQIQLRAMLLYPTPIEGEDEVALFEPFLHKDLPDTWDGSWGRLVIIPVAPGGKIQESCEALKSIPTANMVMLPLIKESIPKDVRNCRILFTTEQFIDTLKHDKFIVSITIDDKGVVTEIRQRLESLVLPGSYVLMFK